MVFCNILLPNLSILRAPFAASSCSANPCAPLANCIHYILLNPFNSKQQRTVLHYIWSQRERSAWPIQMEWARGPHQTDVSGEVNMWTRLSLQHQPRSWVGWPHCQEVRKQDKQRRDRREPKMQYTGQHLSKDLLESSAPAH